MNRRIAALLAAALLLCGCSAYYRSENVSSVKVEGTQQEQEPETQAGPGTDAFSPDDMTIETLELSGGESAARNPEIVVATDIHYYAKELTDFGTAFEDMAQQQNGLLVTYVWEILDAFLDQIIERKPQALILCGDLTLEGERASHNALAQKLERVEHEGIEVLVIPGNHDINNTKASGYINISPHPAEPMDAESFVRVYREYGYSDAISRDPASLSYMYQLQDGTRLLMLDSCQYENGNLIGGVIRDGTYDWIAEQLELAYQERRPVIAVAHHNLLDESRIYESDCTIEHSERLEQLLDDWGVTLFLSGHLHSQHYRESRDYNVQEIVTSALAEWPCQYGILKYFGPEKYDYHTEKTDVTAWAQRKGNPDANLQDFDAYGRELLRQVYYQEAYSSQKGRDLTREVRRGMSNFYAELRLASVAGNVFGIRDWAEEQDAYVWWQDYGYEDIQGMYIEEILEDAVCDFNTFQKNGE